MRRKAVALNICQKPDSPFSKTTKSQDMTLFHRMERIIPLSFLTQILYTTTGICQSEGIVVYHRLYYGTEQPAYQDTLKFNEHQFMYIENRLARQWWSPEGYRITLQARRQYRYFDKRSLNTREVVFLPGKRKAEVWETQANPNNWTIFESFKTIGDYRAQRAETTVPHPLGNYTVTAWFTGDIPVSAGPSGFWGLPGLILELYEDNLGYTKAATINLQAVGDLSPQDFSQTKARKKTADSTQKALQQILQKDGY
jgi:GLPGLI family protein